MRKLILLFLLVPILASAQNFRVDGVVQSRSGAPAPGAFIYVCTQPATTTSTGCTPAPTLCSSLTDVGCTQPNPVQADGLGNYHFYAPTADLPATICFTGSTVTTSCLPDQTFSGGGTTNLTNVLVQNAGTFTNAQMNLYVQSLIGGCNPTTEFHFIQGSVPNQTEAGTFCMTVPGSATVSYATTLQAYMNSGSSTIPAAAFQAFAHATVPNVSIHAGSFVADDGGIGVPNNNYYGIENFMIGHNTASVPIGMLIDGDFFVQPSNAVGLLMAAPNSNHPGMVWPAGIEFYYGATKAVDASNAAMTFFATANSACQPSQGIRFDALDSGSVVRSTFMYADCSGNFNILPQKVGGTVNFTSLTVGNCIGCAVTIDITAHESAGATLDTWINDAIVNSMATNTSAILDATKINGLQTFVHNPFDSLVGHGYFSQKTGVLRLGCNVSIFTEAPIVVPTGWEVVGCGNNFVSVQNSAIHADAVLFPTSYNTGFITCASSVGTGPPFATTCTGSGGATFAANMKDELIMACLTTADGGCSSATQIATASFFGQIQTVNSPTSITVLTPNGGTNATNNGGGGGTPVNFIIYGCIICMGDNSTNGPGNQNFGVEIHGFTIDANGVDGAVPLWDSDCANLCYAYNLLLAPSDNIGLAIMGAQAQNSDFSRMWITAASCNSGNPTGIFVRMSGASTTLNFSDMSVALGSCNTTGSTIDSVFDFEGTVRGMHYVTGSGAGNVAMAIGTNQACPKACPITAGPIIGAVVDDINASGSGAAVIHVGTNNNPASYSIRAIKTIASGNSYTNLLQDDNTGCAETWTTEKVLGQYVVNSQGVISDSTSNIQGCNAPIGVTPRNTSTTSEQVLATDRGGLVTFNNAGAVTVSIADPNTTGFGNNFVAAVCNGGAGTATITPATTTFNVYNSIAPSFTANAANIALTQGQCATIYSTNTKYLVRR